MSKTVHMTMRAPKDLVQQLEEAANQNDRTRTGEAIHRLRQSFVTQTPGVDADLESRPQEGA